MWLRVFAPWDGEVPPETVAERMHAYGLAVVPHFKGDQHGWTSAELHLPDGGSPILLARYLTKEDDLRADLNSHAAELETMTHSPHAVKLMEFVIQTKQMMTVRKPVHTVNESAVESACERLACFLAAATGGVYQIDGRGWFDAQGQRLVEEF